AQTLTANVLLALGCEPSMTLSPPELGSFIESSDGVLINLGTLDDERRQAAIIAAETAFGLGKPVVLDPVFAHRSPSRKRLAEKISSLSPAAIRGNAEELDGLSVKMPNTVLVQTGEQDIATYCGKKAIIENGHHIMANTTAMGCSLGAVMAASISLSEDNLQGAVAALLIFGVAGEIAAKHASGPGSFVPAFLDALYRLDTKDLTTLARVS
ncbi:MAG: hydroxyethylthiazole kinase, partial [Rhizobiales bacterium]|nr:hydroxyethylthiazole kinase [Hyphomicrobiales bacterium]